MVYHLSKPTQPMDKNMGARSLSTCVSSHKFLSAILSLFVYVPLWLSLSKTDRQKNETKHNQIYLSIKSKYSIAMREIRAK